MVDQLASSNLGGGPPAYTPPTSGDLNGNGIHDAGDIDLLTQHVLEGTGDLRFDLNGDLVVNYEDQRVLVEERFKTWRGDSNLDGVFDTSDFVQVFQRGKFETGQQAGWSEGDWSGDFRFDTADFVWAFQSGDYCKGPRAAVAGVPEPSGTRILGLLVMLLGCCKRRRDQGNATVPTNAAGGLPTCWARPSAGS